MTFKPTPIILVGKKRFKYICKSSNKYRIYNNQPYLVKIEEDYNELISQPMFAPLSPEEVEIIKEDKVLESKEEPKVEKPLTAKELRAIKKAEKEAKLEADNTNSGEESEPKEVN